MKARCADPKNPRYGAAGITVCSRWLHGEFGISRFELFAEDLGERPARHWIERLEPRATAQAIAGGRACAIIERGGHRIHEMLTAIREAISGDTVEGALSEGRVVMDAALVRDEIESASDDA